MSLRHKRTRFEGCVGVSVFLCCLAGIATGGCGTEEPTTGQPFLSSLEETASESEGTVLSVAREELAGDVYHYSILLKVGDTPNARLRLHRVVRERAPWRPRPANQAILLLHGDFSTFMSNFAPLLASSAGQPRGGLAVYLAEQGIDVWGLDRRWTTAPSEGADLSDFAEMGFAGALDDVRRALALAREIRGRTGAGGDRLILGGFSRGAHLAYAYAAAEPQRPRAQRHLKGLVPIDIYAAIGPDDEELRQGACARRDEERAQLEAGMYDSDNGFFIELGRLASSAPSDPSPLFSGYTNRAALLTLVAQTYLFYAPKPGYHLAAGVLRGDEVIALKDSPEALFADWLASAPPHQALAEVADSDALWCGEGALPVSGNLGDIQVPLFYLGAAGGFGDHGVYTTMLIGSADVSTHVVRLLEAEREAEDFGHADLLFAADAPTLAWQPLAEWILRH